MRRIEETLRRNEVSLLRIGLDLDGVIVNSIPTWTALLNQGMGTRYGLDDLPETHSTPEMAAFSDQHQLEMLIAPGPVQGAPAAVANLAAAGHELVVITARQPRLRNLTQAWLDYHETPVHGMHFLEGAPKAPTAVAEGIEVMVEDTPYQALALAEAGVPVLLFGAPYNRHVNHPLIHRCEGWDEVLYHMKECSLQKRFLA